MVEVHDVIGKPFLAVCTRYVFLLNQKPPDLTLPLYGGFAFDLGVLFIVGFLILVVALLTVRETFASPWP